MNHQDTTGASPTNQPNQGEATLQNSNIQEETLNSVVVLVELDLGAAANDLNAFVEQSQIGLVPFNIVPQPVTSSLIASLYGHRWLFGSNE
ncbi:hypothetical protein RSAG8_11943, partial [Rhizoctonia solani AG-8 WAC10335]